MDTEDFVTGCRWSILEWSCIVKSWCCLQEYQYCPTRSCKWSLTFRIYMLLHRYCFYSNLIVPISVTQHFHLQKNVLEPPCCFSRILPRRFSSATTWISMGLMPVIAIPKFPLKSRCRWDFLQLSTYSIRISVPSIYKHTFGLSKGMHQESRRIAAGSPELMPSKIGPCESSTNWAPTRFQRSYNPYKWPYKWIFELITLLNYRSYNPYLWLVGLTFCESSGIRKWIRKKNVWNDEPKRFGRCSCLYPRDPVIAPEATVSFWCLDV